MDAEKHARAALEICWVMQEHGVTPADALITLCHAFALIWVAQSEDSPRPRELDHALETEGFARFNAVTLQAVATLRAERAT